MGLADKQRKQLTNTEKDNAAVMNIKRILARGAKTQRQMVKNINKIIKNAPSGKTELMDMLGADKAEALDMINKMKDFANAHKKASDPSLTV
jgi:hypothetical protein